MERTLRDANQVTDPSDWLGTALASLLPIDREFRCPYCKDFFNSPVITSCGHSFCSICIRRCLAHDGKCPFCRASDQESKLRINLALRDAVDAFIASRECMLEFAKAATDNGTSTPGKRKASESVEETAQPPGKRSRMATRLTSHRAAAAAASTARGEADVSVDVEEEKRSKKGESAADLIACAWSLAIWSSCELTITDDGLVECPICLIRMEERLVDKHLDTSCSGSSQTQPSAGIASQSSPVVGFRNARSLVGRQAVAAQARLPTLPYSMYKDTALRKTLRDLGISSTGTRDSLERRHREFITLWNANCDSAKPKSRTELLRDLTEWEKSLSRINVRSTIRDLDASSWAVQHQKSYAGLIAQARNSARRIAEPMRRMTSDLIKDERPECPGETAVPKKNQDDEAVEETSDRIADERPEPIPKKAFQGNQLPKPPSDTRSSPGDQQPLIEDDQESTGDLDIGSNPRGQEHVEPLPETGLTSPH